jgi:hypothetical protein
MGFRSVQLDYRQSILPASEPAVSKIIALICFDPAKSA